MDRKTAQAPPTFTHPEPALQQVIEKFTQE
jgi:hypothetical protein